MRMAKPSRSPSPLSTKERLSRTIGRASTTTTVFIVARDPQTILDVIQTGQVVPHSWSEAQSFPKRGQTPSGGSSRAYVTKDELPAYRAIAGTGSRYHRSLCAGRQAVELSSIITL